MSLLQVASLAGELSPYIIHRYNLERTIAVYSINPALTPPELRHPLRPGLDALDVLAGYHWAPGGEVEAGAKPNAALFLDMSHCLVAIVGLLIWQFRSFHSTATIVLTILLIMISASLGPNLLGVILDFNAILGLFFLAGIIVNNAIVLHRRGTAGRHHTARCAAGRGQGRLRPIVMTT